MPILSNFPSGISDSVQQDINTKQPKITANGLLKGDGNGNITAAEESQVELVELVGGENINVNGNVISTKAFPCNPKLLRNWYFGNPVDQRNGYIIPAGTQIYTDSGLTQLIGGAAYACPVVESTTVYVKVQDTNNSSSYYYAAASDAVHGYIGIRYGIDGWKMWQDAGTVTVGNGGIVIRKSSGEYVQWGEQLEEDVWNALIGKTVTMSALTVDGRLATTTQTFTADGIVTAAAFEGLTFHSTSTLHLLDFVLTGAESPVILAVGLELGSVQTLAHQDANGAWVLNEIPDYGEQLLKCQRYLRPAGTQFITSQASGNIYGSAVMINSYPMRAAPSIVNANYVGCEVREVTGGVAGTITNVFAPGIHGNFTVQLSGTSMPNYVYIDPTGFNPLLSAEL